MKLRVWTLCAPLRAGLFGLVMAAAIAHADNGTTPSPAAQAPVVANNPVRPIHDDLIYFVLPDRFANGDPGNDLGGYPDDRDLSGFDPTRKGYFHGGDLKGLRDKLDYIQGLGVTAIWLAPIFANKPVQGNRPPHPIYSPAPRCDFMVAC